ncbi:MAG: helix-turn-helix domain-containing protein [Myxococcota bacterium]
MKADLPSRVRDVGVHGQRVCGQGAIHFSPRPKNARIASLPTRGASRASRPGGCSLTIYMSQKGFDAPLPVRPLLLADDVARQLSVGVDTVYRLAHARKLAFVRLGRCMRFLPEDVEVLLRAGRVGPSNRL